MMTLHNSNWWSKNGKPELDFKFFIADKFGMSDYLED